MPNVKIFVDDSLYPGIRAPLTQALGPIRDMLCQDLSVDVPACQFAVLPVGAMPDLPRVNVEMAILPRPDRTREVILAVCAKLRAMVEAATHTHVAVRVTALDPETYIALK
ncbi:MAG: hypothetical protein R3D90_10180 [Paracoccaceae bacterium]